MNSSQARESRKFHYVKHIYCHNAFHQLKITDLVISLTLTLSPPILFEHIHVMFRTIFYISVLQFSFSPEKHILISFECSFDGKQVFGCFYRLFGNVSGSSGLLPTLGPATSSPRTHKILWGMYRTHTSSALTYISTIYKLQFIYLRSKHLYIFIYMYFHKKYHIDRNSLCVVYTQSHCLLQRFIYVHSL